MLRNSLKDRRKPLTYLGLRVITAVIIQALIFSPMPGFAKEEPLANFLNLPAPGQMVPLSASFNPVLLKGMVVHPDKPLTFDFMLDQGDSMPAEALAKEGNLKQEASRLIKYFLAALTIPENDLWVNLSPYEHDRIIPQALGETDLGRDLLAQDYILKQVTATLIYPEKELGREFWKRIYKQAQEKFGTTQIPVNTFNKVWILPADAEVFEKNNAAYVTKARLKVMLDEDYTAAAKTNLVGLSGEALSQPTRFETAIIRDLILPEIEKEVNEGSNFAPLRQVYYALILAKWYKQAIKESLLAKVYQDKNKIQGIDLDDKNIKEKIYQRYVQAYKKGVFNYIKEESSSLRRAEGDEAISNGTIIPRKYFSGGTKFFDYQINRAMTAPAELNQSAAMVRVVLDQSSTAMTASAGNISEAMMNSAQDSAAIDRIIDLIQQKKFTERTRAEEFRSFFNNIFLGAANTIISSVAGVTHKDIGGPQAGDVLIEGEIVIKDATSFPENKILFAVAFKDGSKLFIAPQLDWVDTVILNKGGEQSFRFTVFEIETNNKKSIRVFQDDDKYYLKKGGGDRNEIAVGRSYGNEYGVSISRVGDSFRVVNLNDGSLAINFKHDAAMRSENLDIANAGEIESALGLIADAVAPGVNEEGVFISVTIPQNNKAVWMRLVEKGFLPEDEEKGDVEGQIKALLALQSQNPLVSTEIALDDAGLFLTLTLEKTTEERIEFELYLKHDKDGGVRNIKDLKINIDGRDLNFLGDEESLLMEGNWLKPDKRKLAGQVIAFIKKNFVVYNKNASKMSLSELGKDVLAEHLVKSDIGAKLKRNEVLKKLKTREEYMQYRQRKAGSLRLERARLRELKQAAVEAQKVEEAAGKKRAEEALKREALLAEQAAEATRKKIDADARVKKELELAPQRELARKLIRPRDHVKELIRRLSIIKEEANDFPHKDFVLQADTLSHKIKEMIREEGKDTDALLEEAGRFINQLQGEIKIESLPTDRVEALKVLFENVNALDAEINSLRDRWQEIKKSGRQQVSKDLGTELARLRIETEVLAREIQFEGVKVAMREQTEARINANNERIAQIEEARRDIKKWRNRSITLSIALAVGMVIGQVIKNRSSQTLAPAAKIDNIVIGPRVGIDQLPMGDLIKILEQHRARGGEIALADAYAQRIIKEFNNPANVEQAIAAAKLLKKNHFLEEAILSRVNILRGEEQGRYLEILGEWYQGPRKPTAQGKLTMDQVRQEARKSVRAFYESRLWDNTQGISADALESKAILESIWLSPQMVSDVRFTQAVFELIADFKKEEFTFSGPKAQTRFNMGIRSLFLNMAGAKELLSGWVNMKMPPGKPNTESPEFSYKAEATFLKMYYFNFLPETEKRKVDSTEILQLLDAINYLLPVTVMPEGMWPVVYQALRYSPIDKRGQPAFDKLADLAWMQLKLIDSPQGRINVLDIFGLLSYGENRFTQLARENGRECFKILSEARLNPKGPIEKVPTTVELATLFNIFAKIPKEIADEKWEEVAGFLQTNVGRMSKLDLDRMAWFLQHQARSPQDVLFLLNHPQEAVRIEAVRALKIRFPNNFRDILPQIKDTKTKALVDAAQASVQREGGIDFKAIDVAQKGETVRFNIDEAQLKSLLSDDFKGFTPVIVEITTIPSALPLFGLQ